MSQAVQKMMLGVFKRLPDSWLVKMAGGTPLEVAGRTLDPMLQLMSVEGKKQPPLESMSPQDARVATKAGLSAALPKPRQMAIVKDRKIAGPASNIAIRVYKPLGSGPMVPLVLYFHQGGFVIGDIDICEPFCTLLADVAKCVVVSVEYRLAPEHKFPAPVDDATAVYHWAEEHASEIGGDPTRIIVAGDSAGGQLAAVLARKMKEEGRRSPVYQVLIYPWLQAVGDSQSYQTFGDAYPLSSAAMAWFVKQYLNDPSERFDTRVSPLLEERFDGLPPALIVTAGFDPLSDEGRAYADKLRDAGVPVTFRCYEHLCHAFTALGGASPAAMRACEEIANDLREFVKSTE